MAVVDVAVGMDDDVIDEPLPEACAPELFFCTVVCDCAEALA
jgi:hypothetical protein